MRPIVHILIYGVIITSGLLSGCRSTRVFNDPPPCTIAFTLFESNGEDIVSETVRDSLIHFFFKTTNTKIKKSTEGDIIIKGFISLSYGETGAQSAGVFATPQSLAGASKGRNAGGAYVTGITAQAYKDGELIAVSSIGQDLKKGIIRAPVSMARQCASELVSQLRHAREVGPRRR